jgi:hypothetical protein
MTEAEKTLRVAHYLAERACYLIESLGGSAMFIKDVFEKKHVLHTRTKTPYTDAMARSALKIMKQVENYVHIEDLEESYRSIKH